MAYAATAKFICTIYDAMTIGQYATIDFAAIDYPTLFAQESLADVNIMMVCTHEETINRPTPSAPRARNSHHSVMSIGSGSTNENIKIVEEKYLAPSDIYSRADVKLIVITEGKLAILRSPCVIGAAHPFYGHYSL